MESLSPNFFVRDLNKTIEFYKILGFSIVTTVPESGELDWAMMACGKVTVMFQTFKNLADKLPEISRKDGGSLLLYIQLIGIRAFFESIKNKIPILHGLEKTFYGATEFSVIDNNGYVLTFAEDEKQ